MREQEEHPASVHPTYPPLVAVFPLTPRKTPSREGAGADLMYDLPMNRAVAQTRTPRRPFWPTESGVEWAYQRKMSPAAATQQQPAAGEEGGGTLVWPTHNSCRLAGMLPTLWMPTGSSVLVNFDRAPGPLHPTAIVLKGKCRGFRKGYTTGSRLGSGSPVVCPPLECKSRSQRQKHKEGKKGGKRRSWN